MWKLLRFIQSEFAKFYVLVNSTIFVGSPDKFIVISQLNGSTHDVYISPGGLNWLISVNYEFSIFGTGFDVLQPENIGGFLGPGFLAGRRDYYQSIGCPKEDGDVPASPVY